MYKMNCFAFLMRRTQMNRLRIFVKKRYVCVALAVLSLGLYIMSSHFYVGIYEVNDRLFTEHMDYTLKTVRGNTNQNAVQRVVNSYEFNFHRNPELITCKGQDVNLIYMIKSAVGNFERRTAIRRTWANDEILKHLNLRRIFVVGLSNEVLNERRLLLEMDSNHDMLQIDFHDDYYNITLKTTGAVNWVKQYCSNARYVLFVDDDYFISTEKLVKYVNSSEYTKTKCIYTGWINLSKPIRDKGSRWYVSEKDYPNDTYPPFLHGGGWLASKSFIDVLSVGIQYTKRFIFDDVFIGMVAKKLNVTPCHEPRFAAGVRVNYNQPSFKTIFASHGYGIPSDLSRAWNCTVTPLSSLIYPKYCVIK